MYANTNKVVITGASGFIGRNLLFALQKNGNKVLSLGRDNTDYSVIDLNSKLEGYDTLVHLAGKRLTRQTNMEYVSSFTNSSIPILDNLLKVAKEHQFSKVITASSIGVYSLNNSTPFKESETPKPSNPYGIGKYINERIVDMWGQNHDVITSHIRLAACYGHGEKDSPALMKFVRQAINNETIKLTHGGGYKIDQIYIKDAVDAFLKLINSNISGVFNIGSGMSYNIKEISEIVSKIFSGNKKIEISGNRNINEPERHMDISKAIKILQWEPQYNLEQGLEDMKLEIENADN